MDWPIIIDCFTAMPDDEVADEGVEQEGDPTSTTEPSIFILCELV
jgi:hypothetical protein